MTTINVPLFPLSVIYILSGNTVRAVQPELCMETELTRIRLYRARAEDNTVYCSLLYYLWPELLFSSGSG